MSRNPNEVTEQMRSMSDQEWPKTWQKSNSKDHEVAAWVASEKQPGQGSWSLYKREGHGEMK